MTRLHPAEIKRIQTLRAENLRLVQKSKDNHANNPVDDLRKSPLQLISAKCFNATLNADDLRYIALAVLQMQDELFEARERIRRLEALNGEDPQS